MKALLDDLRATRLTIAHKRAKDTGNRYPEISITDVQPLDDDRLIEHALQRELAFQRQVLADIERGAAK